MINDSKYEEAMELLDEIHQALYPLYPIVTTYDSTSISSDLAIKINKFKQKMQWVRKERNTDEYF